MGHTGVPRASIINTLEPHPHTWPRGGGGSLTRRTDNSRTNVWHKQGPKERHDSQGPRLQFRPAEGWSDRRHSSRTHRGEGITKGTLSLWSHTAIQCKMWASPTQNSSWLTLGIYKTHMCMCCVCFVTKTRRHLSYRIVEGHTSGELNRGYIQHRSTLNTGSRSRRMTLLISSWSFLVLVWFFLSSFSLLNVLRQCKLMCSDKNWSAPASVRRKW